MSKTITIRTLNESFQVKIEDQKDNLKELHYQIEKYNPEYVLSFQHLFRFNIDNIENIENIDNIQNNYLTKDDVINDGETIGLLMLIDIDIDIEETQGLGETHFLLKWKPSHYTANDENEENDYNENDENRIYITYCYLTLHPEQTYFYEGVYGDNDDEKKYMYKDLSKMLKDILYFKCNWNSFYQELLVKKMIEMIYDRIPEPFSIRYKKFLDGY